MSMFPPRPLPVSAFSKDQRNSDGYLPGDEEQAAKHFTKHVLVLSQQRHGVHPFQACPGGLPRHSLYYINHLFVNHCLITNVLSHDT